MKRRTRGSWRPQEPANDEAVSIAASQAGREISTDEKPNGDLCSISFPGQWSDEESGLCYNRFRFYDVNVAQYTSSDPIGFEGGARPQAYAIAATAWNDPQGLAGNPANVELFNGYVIGSHEDVVAFNKANGINNASHHILQDAAMRGFPGYDTNKATTIGFYTRRGDTGSEHWNANATQRNATSSGNVGVEKDIARQALKDAGVPGDVIDKAMGKTDKYLNSIGATNATKT